MGKYLKEYRLDVEYVYDLLQFTKDIKPQVKRILKNELKERGPIKFAICAEVSLIKPLTGESAFPVFRTSQIALLLNTEINGLLEGIPTVYTTRPSHSTSTISSRNSLSPHGLQTQDFMSKPDRLLLAHSSIVPQY